MIDMVAFSVRYIENDIDEAISFYTRHFGFTVQMHPNSAFAILARDGLRLMLSTPRGPGGGAQPTSDGNRPAPGGWNRIQIQVRDLAGAVASLRAAGVPFCTDIIVGVGAKQALVADPSGNLVELHELLPRPA